MLRGDAIWCALIASVLLTPLAVTTRWWLIMWIAAILSAAVSHAGIFSIGPLTFLLTCLQLAAACALRRSPAGEGYGAPLLVGLAVWAAVVPVQIVSLALFGRALLGWYHLFPLVAAIGTIAVLLSGRVRLPSG